MYTTQHTHLFIYFIASCDQPCQNWNPNLILCETLPDRFLISYPKQAKQKLRLPGNRNFANVFTILNAIRPIFGGNFVFCKAIWNSILARLITRSNNLNMHNEFCNLKLGRICSNNQQRDFRNAYACYFHMELHMLKVAGNESWLLLSPRKYLDLNFK